MDGDSLVGNSHLNDSPHLGYSNQKITSNGTPPDEKPLGRVRRYYSTDIETRLLNCLHNAAANPNMDQSSLSLLLTMQQIHSEVKFIARRMEREDEIQEAKNDWRFAAMVVDRLCLYLFTALIILSTCGIFFAAPHLVA